MELECKSQDNVVVSSSNVKVADDNEPLGSVTQLTDSEGGVQLRTSARVSKKLKLDSLAQAIQSTSEKKGKQWFSQVCTLKYHHIVLKCES